MKQDGSATVQWKSQSRGRWSTKKGKILARLDPYEDAMAYLRNIPSCQVMTRSPLSKHKRYVVACDGGDGKIYYYTPRCSAVDASRNIVKTNRKKAERTGTRSQKVVSISDMSRILSELKKIREELKEIREMMEE